MFRNYVFEVKDKTLDDMKDKDKGYSGVKGKDN